MSGLWADGWFYISSAGLLVSGVLFVFLLGQYRLASEAADASESEAGADKDVVSTAPIKPVYVPEEEAPAKVVSHAAVEEAPKKEAKPAPAAEESAAPQKEAANTTGGLSPAVAYLQNIKGELDELHKDIRVLAKRVDDELSAVSTRDEALIDRLSELARAVEALKSSAPAAAGDEPAPAPKKARKTEKAPEPAPAAETAVAPAPEPAAAAEPAPIVIAPEPAAAAPAAEPARSPDETIRMELGALVAPPAAEPAAQAPAEPEAKAAEPTQPEPPPEDKPRRGPVWPV